ncbi:MULTISPECIES: hypothetical protein [Ottowia]|uniref:hypothetical protein n=1 Tax=Ottowia TaxID=219181 RepID=UPI002CE9BEF7|nr:hypothetical protein [Ottowia sp.]HRN75288.1 hypothetical protein [Ottowia sp.]HRQ02486.1 hypothetical protein [Ottowia sp.]
MIPSRLSLLAATGALALLAGCAALQPKTPEQIVAERSLARWNALIKRDFAAGHAYYQPAFRAAFKPADVEQVDGPPRAHHARVQQVSCEAERCTARVVFKLNTRSARRGTWEIETVRDETWVRQDGQWWYERAGL